MTMYKLLVRYIYNREYEDRRGKGRRRVIVVVVVVAKLSHMPSVIDEHAPSQKILPRKKYEEKQETKWTLKSPLICFGRSPSPVRKRWAEMQNTIQGGWGKNDTRPDDD